MAHSNASANQALSGPHGTIVSGIGPIPVAPVISASTSRQKSKAYNSSIAVGAEDVKYAAKYRDLKRKVKDIENDNDKLLFKVLQAKRNIQRAQLERAILYERLVAIPASPPPNHAVPPQHPNAQGPGAQPGPPPAHANNGQWSQPPPAPAGPPPHQVHHQQPVQTVPYESRRHGTIQVIAGPDGHPVRDADGRVIPAPPANLPPVAPAPGYGADPHIHQSQSGRGQQQHLESLPLPPHPQPQSQSSGRGHSHSHGHHGHEHERSGSNSRSHSHSNQSHGQQHSYRDNVERGHHQHRAPGPPPPLQPMMADSPPDPQPPRSRRHDISELTHSSSTSPHVHHAMPQNQTMPAPDHVSPPPGRGHSHSSQSHSHSSMSPVEGRQHTRMFHRHQRIGPGANINQDRDRERERERISSPPFSRAPADDDMVDDVNTSSNRSFHSDDRPRGADTARPNERRRSLGSHLSDLVNTESAVKLPPSDAPSEQPLRANPSDDMDVDAPGGPPSYGTGTAGFNPRDDRRSRYAGQDRGQSDSPHPSASGIPTSDAPANQDPLSSSHSQTHSGVPGSGEEASGSG